MQPDGQGGLALRLGFRQIKGLREDDAVWISAARGNGYLSVEDVWRRAGLAPAVLARLAEADVFAGLGLTRRHALWEAKALRSTAPLPLFGGDIEGEGIVEPAAYLPQMSLGELEPMEQLLLRISVCGYLPGELNIEGEEEPMPVEGSMRITDDDGLINTSFDWSFVPVRLQD